MPRSLTFTSLRHFSALLNKPHSSAETAHTKPKEHAAYLRMFRRGRPARIPLKQFPEHCTSADGRLDYSTSKTFPRINRNHGEAAPAHSLRLRSSTWRNLMIVTHRVAANYYYWGRGHMDFNYNHMFLFRNCTVLLSILNAQTPHRSERTLAANKNLKAFRYPCLLCGMIR